MQLLIVVTFALFAGIFWFLGDRILGQQFNELESQAIRDDLGRLQEAIDDQLEYFAKTSGDYGHWLDTWKYVVDLNPGYEESNLNVETLKNLGVSHMIYLDSVGKLVKHYGANIHAEDGDTIPLAAEILGKLDVKSPHFKALGHLSQGWIEVGDSVAWLFGVSGITQDYLDSSVRGYLVFVREIDSVMLERFQKRVRLDLKMQVGRIAPPGALVLDSLVGRGSVSRVFLGAEPVRGANGVRQSQGFLQTGIGGSLLFELLHSRQIEASGQGSVRFLNWILLTICVALLLLLLIVLRQVIVRPLEDLQDRFQRIENSGDYSLRVPTTGPKEVRTLSRAINSMLAHYADAMNNLEASEGEQRALAAQLTATYAFMLRLVDFLPDSTFAVDGKGKVMAWNLSMVETTKKSFDEMKGKDLDQVSEVLYGSVRHLLMESFFNHELGAETFPERTQLPDGAFHFEEFVATQDDNNGRFLDQTAIALRDGQGKFLGALQIIRDVTEQKRAEIRLEFLSLHDPLTGLFNRTYYAEVSAGLSTPANLPLGVILIDLDGLKLVNDTLGHEHGDALILAAAGIMRKVFGNVPVARIGGDEFVTFFTKSAEGLVRGAVERLVEACEEHNAKNPPLPVQMSAGFAWSDSHCDLADLVKEADARMYREKDLRRESVRLGYVTSLQRRYEEVHRKDKDVTERLISLSQRFAKFLGQDEESIARLLLLARFRDIGKVGLSERIMLKPGPLDKDEQAEMQKQPEIGYRIARISRELAPIADLILKHREWWDGRGYPLGISGEQIPYLNRVLAVVEVYVAMTGPRLRSRTVTAQEALEEIGTMAGKKLEPALVTSFGKFLLQ
jgi:diguanylate cyclase (GGDEF)-like protein